MPTESVLPDSTMVTDASAPTASSSRRAARASRSEPQPPAAVQAPAEPFELLEPVVGEPETLVIDEEVAAEASGADLFETASRLFSFTGETPVQSRSEEPAEERVYEPVSAASIPPARSGVAFRRLATASFSIGVMGVVGLMAVGMTTPAQAVAAATGAESTVAVVTEGAKPTSIDADEIQAYVAPAGTENPAVARTENYSTSSMSELAYASGISNIANTFVNDPTAAIQWPFSVGVPISYGFGMRSGRMHEGVDFTPGAGSPVQAIADGVVREATSSGGAYGVHVIIDHVIDGQLISSHYAHLQYGSIQVQQGQTVTVGTVLGRTGNTGRSFGAHTHFELLVGGTTAIDPLPWLREHTGG